MFNFTTLQLISSSAPTIVRNNSVNPTNWIRYQGSQQIPYQQHQFIGSSIPSFRQQIAPRHQPRHIMQRPSNAIVIIDPKTKQPIELVKSSSISNQRTNQCNLFPNGGHYRKEQFEGKCFNKNRPKIKDPDTNHCRDFTGCVSSDQVDTNNNDLSVNTHVAKDQEVLKNTEPSVEPIVNVPIVIPFVIPIVVLESVINNEEKKAVDDLNIILPEPVPEVKQCLDPPIIPSSINEVIQIGPSFVESKPPKTVKNKAPVAPKPSNEGKSNKLSKNNEKNKRRRAAIVKQ